MSIEDEDERIFQVKVLGENMTIEVRLFATLREGRGKVLESIFEEPVRPRDVIESLGIPEKDVAILLINGRDGLMDTLLKEGDKVSIFPPVGGG